MRCAVAWDPHSRQWQCAGRRALCNSQDSRVTTARRRPAGARVYCAPAASDVARGRSGRDRYASSVLAVLAGFLVSALASGRCGGCSLARRAASGRLFGRIGAIPPALHGVAVECRYRAVDGRGAQYWIVAAEQRDIAARQIINDDIPPTEGGGVTSSSARGNPAQGGALQHVGQRQVKLHCFGVFACEVKPSLRWKASESGLVL